MTTPTRKLPNFLNNLAVIGTRPQSLQRDELVRLCWNANNRIRIAIMPFKLESKIIYAEKDDLERFYSELISNMLSNYKKHISQYKSSKKALSLASKNVQESAKKSIKKMSLSFNNWVKALEGFSTPIIAPFAIEYSLDKKLRVLLKKEFGEKSGEIFDIITSPTQLNKYQKMRITIAKLAISGKADSERLRELVNNYGWYSAYSYLEPTLNEEYFRKEISKLSKEKALAEKTRILAEIRRNKTLFKNLKKSIKSSEIKKIGAIINDYVFLRTDRIEALKVSQARIRPFFERISKELSYKTRKEWNYDEVANLTNQEIFDFLEKEKIPDKSYIKKRLRHEYLYYFDKRVQIIYDKRLIRQAQNIVNNSDNKKEMKGRVAFKGRVRGKAVLITIKKELNKIKKGDIMVARITMPDYTPAMKLASAIVTEEGGITSHAAIVARELKKPCIVGTRNCTKLIKDGDYIEVNANKGIVRKIR